LIKNGVKVRGLTRATLKLILLDCLRLAAWPRQHAMALIFNVRGIDQGLQQSLHVVERTYSVELSIRKIELLHVPQNLLGTTHPFMVVLLPCHVRLL